MGDSGFSALRSSLLSRYGLDISGYKQNFVERRLELRMKARGSDSYSAYSRLVASEPEEYRRLLETLSINVSEFFRNPPAFNALWGCLEEIFLRKTERGQHFVRIWSAGCSEGEEPYTISITLHELLADLLPSYSVSITATDIDADALSKAQSGAYPPSKLKNVGSALLEKYFSRQEKLYAVAPRVKSLVRFSEKSVLDAKEMGNFDLVVCRNLLIYFERQQQQVIFENMRQALHKGGYLFLGNTETLPPDEARHYETVDAASRIYRKL